VQFPVQLFKRERVNAHFLDERKGARISTNQLRNGKIVPTNRLLTATHLPVVSAPIGPSWKQRQRWQQTVKRGEANGWHIHTWINGFVNLRKSDSSRDPEYLSGKLSSSRACATLDDMVESEVRPVSTSCAAESVNTPTRYGR
jgi:hypothetical protein